MKIYIRLMRDPLSMLGMGMNLVGSKLLGDYNDQRQIDQQGALINQQSIANKDMAMFNKQLQMDMWKQTGPVGMMEQLKLAGLNPALMYGMSGAGSGTTGSQGGSVDSARAPAGGGEVIGMLGLQSQLALQEAQKENIEADTKNKIATRHKTDQDTISEDLANDITEYLNTFDENGKESTGELDKDGKLVRDPRENSMAVQLKKAELKKAAQEAVNAEVQKRLMEQGIKVDQATIDKMSADILQRAQEIDIKGGELAVQKALQEFQTSWSKIIGETGAGIVGGIFSKILSKKTPPAKPININVNK